MSGWSGMEVLLLVINIVLLLVLIIIVYRSYLPAVYRFYKPSCPACEASKTAWETFKSSVGYFGARFTEYDLEATDEDELADAKRVAENFGVVTVPQVWLVDSSGVRVMYNGERTAEDYKTWFDSVVVNN